MNRNLFESKKRSILHYEKEIKNLEDALSVTKSVLGDLEKDFVENFCPFKEGDIILIDNKVVKFVKIGNRYGSLYRSINNFCATVRFSASDRSDGYGADTSIDLPFDLEGSNVKILNI